jgi:predicted transcriptional regulator
VASIQVENSDDHAKKPYAFYNKIVIEVDFGLPRGDGSGSTASA